MASSTKQITLGGVKYTLVKQIGRGAYGQVWCALDDKNQEFAIKLEDKSQFVHSNFGIAKEMNIYTHLKGIKGFPNVIGNGETGEENFMVMELLGTSLKDAFIERQQIDVVELGYQMVTILEKVHATGFVHNDIKPDNIALNAEQKWTLFDFGLSDYLGYVTSTKEGCRRAGNGLFISIEMLRGTLEYSNDIKSLAYMLTFLSKLSLPWDEFCLHQTEMPITTFLDELLQRKIGQTKNIIDNLPEPLHEFVLTALQMKGEVNYDLLRSILRKKYP